MFQSDNKLIINEQLKFGNNALLNTATAINRNNYKHNQDMQ